MVYLGCTGNIARTMDAQMLASAHVTINFALAAVKRLISTLKGRLAFCTHFTYLYPHSAARLSATNASIHSGWTRIEVRVQIFDSIEKSPKSTLLMCIYCSLGIALGSTITSRRARLPHSGTHSTITFDLKHNTITPTRIQRCPHHV